MTTRKKAATLAALFAIGSAAAGSSLVSAQTPTPPTPPAAGSGHGEHHPGLRAAIAHLERIKDNLQKDPRDFGGHKEKAVDLITQAQQELQQGLQSDKQ